MKMNSIPKVQRAGVRTKFPKLKTYLRNYVNAVNTLESEELPRLRRYIESGSFRFRYAPEFDESDFKAWDGMMAVRRVASVRKWEAVQAALSGAGNWIDRWTESVSYDYWVNRFEIRDYRRMYDDFQSGRRRQLLASLFLVRIGEAVASCLSLGWTDRAVDLARRSQWGFDHQGFNDGDDESHRRTQHFVLRLVGRWQGWPERDGPRCAFDEPLFNALVDYWDTPNPADVAPLLLAAADRHTHEARPDSNKGHFDISRSGAEYNPFEILSVLRLRQLRGLANPELDHPLLSTPLGHLLPVQSEYTDDLLEGVLARVRIEFPDL